MEEHNPFRHPASSSSSRRPSNDDDERDETPDIDITTQATRAHPPQHLQPTGTSIERLIFGFSNPQANLPMPLANRLPMPPHLTANLLKNRWMGGSNPYDPLNHSVPVPLPVTLATVDIAKISRAPLNIPTDSFRISESLRNEIRNFEALEKDTLDILFDRVHSEANMYAGIRSEMARAKLISNVQEISHMLTAQDRRDLEIRRNRRVTRIKNQEYENANESAMKWLILECNNNNNNQDGIHGEIHNQIQSQSQQLQLTPAPAATTASLSEQPSSQQHNHQPEPTRKRRRNQ